MLNEFEHSSLDQEALEIAGVIVVKAMMLAGLNGVAQLALGSGTSELALTRSSQINRRNPAHMTACVRCTGLFEAGGEILHRNIHLCN
ncbi:MAG: hypothetical protein LW838_11700 [Nitrosomonadaceae bacterium]|nr:hypothetical protein [Nitrosomonadaceae bacterium]